MTRTELEKLTKEELITEYLDLLDDYHWYCNRFKASERYNTKVEIPISVILETIFSDDNKDVETLCRWAKKYEFVDLIKKDENDKLGYYKLQDDYTKQSFYIWLDKEERKQYDYEDYLLDINENYKQALKDIKTLIQHYGNEEKIIDIINKALGDKE